MNTKRRTWPGWVIVFVLVMFILMVTIAISRS